MLELPIKNNSYLIVGSYALGVKEARDIDIIVYKNDIEVNVPDGEYITHFYHNGKKVECLLADKQESLQVLLKAHLHCMKKGFYHDNIASELTLFILKAGHIHFPHRQWEKHIRDYSILRKMVIGVDEEILNEWFDDKYTISQLIYLHKKCTEEHLGRKLKTPRLKDVTKEEFFDDFVIKYVEHDRIHEWMAHREKPMYSYMQPDPSKVYCSKDLWDLFSFKDKVQCVLEEAYVIASERHIIPSLMQKTDVKSKPLAPREAFKWALMRICTTLCSGWFRQFAIDNYFSILNNYNPDYHLKINLKELQDGN